jgi:hypothetical protein
MKPINKLSTPILSSSRAPQPSYNHLSARLYAGMAGQAFGVEARSLEDLLCWFYKAAQKLANPLCSELTLPSTACHVD